MTHDEVEEMFNRFGPMVFRRARTLLGNDEAGKDMMQDVFIKAMAEPQRFAEPSQAASWLYRVTTNACLNQIRDSRQRSVLQKRHLGDEAPIDSAADTKLVARQILAEADKSCSEAAVLVHVDGMSYDEASEVLGVSKRTVSNLLTRFRTFAIARLAEGKSVDVLSALGTPRDEGCPSDLVLSEYGAEVLANRAPIALHVQGCERCKSWLEAERAAFDAITADERQRMVSTIHAAARRRTRAIPTWIGGMVAAAASVLVFVSLPDPAPDTTAKGSGLSLRIYRDRDGRVTKALSGETFRAKDRLRFEIDLPRAAQTMIVGLEAGGAIYPCFPQEMPTSVALPARDAQLLPDAIELDDASGRETLYLVSCPRPFTLADLHRSGTVLEPPPNCQIATFAVDKEQVVTARLVLMLALIGPAAGARAATHLIAVGNNQGRADEPHLRFAERDAQELSNVLRRIGRVSAENSRLLLGEDAESFRRVLINANVRLRASGDTEGDALVIYYSGHADAAGLHLGSTVLAYDELKALVQGSPAQVRLLIIDSCQSGGITQIKGADPAPAFAIRIEQRLDAEGFAIITSSAGTEESQESESLRASFFTHHFVTALRGAADLDRDGRVTLDEAYRYAYQGTLHSSGRTTKLQHPTYLYDLKGKGEFALTFPGASTDLQGRLDIPGAGSYLILENGESGAVVAEVTVEQSGAQLSLAPGKYFVRKRSELSYREYSVELVVGRAVDLGREPYEEITYARLLRKGGGARDSFHSISVMGGVGSSMISGYGLTKSVALGYALDFSWITVGLEARLGLSGAESDTVEGDARELSARIRAERFFDLDFASVALGVLVEGLSVHQSFVSAGDAPSRDSWALGLGSLLVVERTLTPNLSLRLEGGVVTHIVPTATIEAGAAVSSRIETPLSGYVSLGGRFSL